MKYTPKYFKENMPEWKRKKDAILTKIFYRPISFIGASIFSQFGISANTVSYISAVIAVIACCCFLVPVHKIQIIGAILINIWIIFDCIDGNIARSVRMQPFGEFADSISSYILVGLMCTCMGISVYFNGGILIEPYNVWIVLIGAIASSSDSLMRLIYQKYKNTERNMADKGIVEIEDDVRKDNSKVGSFRVRVEMELGIGGFLPFVILIGAIFNILDIVVLYCFAYYLLSFIIALFVYVRKAIKKSKLTENS